MMIAGFFGAWEIILPLAMPMFLAFFAFWIWMLVSAIQNKGLSDSEKVGWVLAIVFLHLLGALLYFFIGHPKRLAAIPPNQSLRA